MPTRNEFGTHLMCLAGAIAQSQGPIIECGMGHFSSRLICDSRRQAVGYETDCSWLAEMARHYSRPGYDMRMCPLSDLGMIDWNRVNFCEPGRWGVALIDQHPTAGRLVAISALSDICDFIVVHDTECPTYYYEPLLRTFRFRFDDDCIPRTTVVSNSFHFRPTSSV